MKRKPNYSITIIEKDQSVLDCYAKTRKEALEITNAAEKVRKCQAWRITYTKFLVNETDTKTKEINATM